MAENYIENEIMEIHNSIDRVFNSILSDKGEFPAITYLQCLQTAYDLKKFIPAYIEQRVSSIDGELKRHFEKWKAEHIEMYEELGRDFYYDYPFLKEDPKG